MSDAAQVKERPMLFSAPMVRALLDGTKTQTRRIAKVFAGRDELEMILRNHPNQKGCPYGERGERLWVRETWAYNPEIPGSASRALFRADPGHEHDGITWKPSIHMPRALSRILLEITDVRVQRLQDISAEDCLAEGCPCYVCGRIMDGLSEADCHCHHAKPAPSDYRNLWEQINGAGAWDANPWVWAISFRRLKP
jgi:hypothetical protein